MSSKASFTLHELNWTREYSARANQRQRSHRTKWNLRSGTPVLILLILTFGGNSLPLPFRPFSPPLPSVPLRSRPLQFPSLPISRPPALPSLPSCLEAGLPLRLGGIWGSLGVHKLPSGSERSPAVKRILMHFRHKFAPFSLLNDE